jgi:Fe-S cluster assembly protein SufD
MNAITHTPAETALIDALEGAEGWVGRLRDVTRANGLPTRRNELWKWSDLRRAGTGIETAGTVTIDGASASVIEPDDGAVLDLSIDASAGVSARSLSFVARAGRSVTLIERYRAEASSLAHIHFDLTVEAGAKLERVCIQDDAGDGALVSSTDISLGAGARLSQAIFSFGSKLSRHETHITHPGEGAEVHLGGVYLLDEGRHADFTSSVTHTGPGGVTRQLVKGAASAHARGVFQGKFKVDRAAQKTDARMTHRALMLDERAEIDAKPELEIYADDVQCAHGNALGALDETALFYMRQRGLPEAKARALLIESFLAEPLDAISDENLRGALKTMLRNRLEAMTA